MFPLIANAGCYSDDCSNRQNANESSGMALRYGGSYDQSGAIRYNYLNPQRPMNPDNYSSGGSLTPEQQERLNQLNQQTKSLLDPNSLMNRTIQGNPTP